MIRAVTFPYPHLSPPRLYSCCSRFLSSMEAPPCPGFRKKDGRACGNNCSFGKPACCKHEDEPKESLDRARRKEALKWVKYCETRMDTSSPPNSACAASESDDATSGDNSETPLLPPFDPAAPSGSGATTAPASAATAPGLPFRQTSAPAVSPRPRRRQTVIDASKVTKMITMMVIEREQKDDQIERLHDRVADLTHQLQASHINEDVSSIPWTPEMGAIIMDYMVNHIKQVGTVDLDNLDNVTTNEVVDMVAHLFNSAP